MTTIGTYQDSCPNQTGHEIRFVSNGNPQQTQAHVYRIETSGQRSFLSTISASCITIEGASTSQRAFDTRRWQPPDQTLAQLSREQQSALMTTLKPQGSRKIELGPWQFTGPSTLSIFDPR